MSRYANPPLATIAVPTVEMVITAARVIIDRIRGDVTIPSQADSAALPPDRAEFRLTRVRPRDLQLTHFVGGNPCEFHDVARRITFCLHSASYIELCVLHGH